MTTPQIIPAKLDLKRTEKLEILWQDGLRSVYTLSYLRTKCPCATCKGVREEQSQRKSLLNILPGNFSSDLSVVNAQRVGNYALQIDWSDNHGSGIYSFEYLRSISPPPKE